MCEWYQKLEVILFFLGMVLFIFVSIYLGIEEEKRKNERFKTPSLIFNYKR